MQSGVRFIYSEILLGRIPLGFTVLRRNIAHNYEMKGTAARFAWCA